MSQELASRRLTPTGTTAVRLYTLHSKAMTQLAHGTCVVIASLLAIPDGIALIPRSTDLVSWSLSVIGVWLSAAVLWFVGFLGILHCVSFLVKGIELNEQGIKMWRFARLIAWDRIDAVAIEPQIFFSKIFSLKPVARKLTIFERKKSWRKGAEPHLVPHHLPSFFFAPEDFDRLFADITQRKFDYVPTFPDVVVAEGETFARLKSVYGLLAWQRIALTILISCGLVMLLGRKAIVNYQYNSGNKAMRAKNFSLARERYETAALVDPTFAAAWNNLANAEFLLGDFANAEKHWDRALFYKPDFVEAKISLAYFALQKRQFPKAKDLIDSALNLAPTNAAALVSRADYAMRLGHVHDAIRDARQVIADEPKRTSEQRFTAACILAQARLRQGKSEEAEKVLEDLAPVPNPQARNGQNITFRLLVSSQVARALGKLEPAKEAIDVAVQRAQRSAETLIEAANVQSALKDFKSAATTFDAAEKIAPDNPWVYICRAQSLMLQPGAKARVVAQLSLAFQCPHQDSESLAQTAKLYDELGEKEKAREAARQALKIESNTPLALSILKSD